MLTLVISTPLPMAPTTIAANRARWRPWVEAVVARGEALHWFLRVGRGGVVVFDVPDNERLHELLTEWLELIPAHFEVYPLVSPEAQAQLLSRQLAASEEPTE